MSPHTKKWDLKLPPQYQKMGPSILKKKIYVMPIYVICIEDMVKGIFLVFFCKRDMIFFSETYIHIGPIALQTSLFILQEKPQSITNIT